MQRAVGVLTKNKDIKKYNVYIRCERNIPDIAGSEVTLDIHNICRCVSAGKSVDGLHRVVKCELFFAAQKK